MEKKKITIGLDIGITSVGYAILDEDKNIIKMGVRLFEEPTADKGKTAASVRRGHRGARRLIRRRQLKLKELLRMFVDYKLVNNIEEAKSILVTGAYDQDGCVQKPFEIKLKGLSQQLSQAEIIVLLYYYMHHRGWFYEVDDDDNQPKGIEIQKINEELHLEPHQWFPCQYQQYWFEKHHKLLGTNFNDGFSNKDYVKEIQKIFENQPQLSPTFKDEYLKLFQFIRSFETGPGSQKSPTEFGLWYVENGETKCRGEKLWEALIGKCSVYPSEKRGLSKAPLTEYFNFINELNTIYFHEKRETKLDLAERNQILSKFNQLDNKKCFIVTPTEMVKVFNQLPRFDDQKIELNDVCGVKHKKSKDKKTKDDFEFCQFKNLKLIVETLYNNGIIKDGEFNILNLEDVKKVNDFFVSLVSGQNDKALLRKLIKENQYFDLSEDSESNQLVIDTLANKLTGFSGTSSLSYKAMEDYIQTTFSQDKAMNQMQYFEEIRSDIEGSRLNLTKYFPKNIFKDEIIPVTTKRAFNQTIAVINKILKLYGKTYDIQNVIIELARETNTADQKRWIDEKQKQNKKKKDELKERYGISPELLFGENLEKVLLWDEQEHKDIYDNQPINLETLLNSPMLYHIDHIIPYSISLNNSRSNKVLTSSSNNKDKLNQTPYQWLSHQGKFNEFKTRVERIYGDKKELDLKMKNLLYLDDPSSQQLDFLERNLVDTRYATRLVLNQLTDFFKNNEHWKYQDQHGLDKYPLVKVINGSLTNYARYNLFTDDNNRTEEMLKKNRDIYNHHAVDAAIIAFLGSNFGIQKRLKFVSSYDKYKPRINDKGQHEFVDIDTGEILNSYMFLLQKNEEVNRFKNELIKILDHDNIYNNEELVDPCKRWIGFSRLKSTKRTGSISNETIYSVKPDQDNQTGSIIAKLNLLKEKNADLAKYFNIAEETKQMQSLLCYKHDRKLFKILQKIFYEFANDPKKNAFEIYIDEFNKLNNTNYQNTVPININGKIKTITSLRYVYKQVEIDDVLILKKGLNNNSKKLAMVNKLTAFGSRIYRNKVGKLVGFNINIKLLTFNKKNKCFQIDQDKLNKKLNSLNIDIHAPYLELYRNQCFVDNNGMIWYSIGSVNDSINGLEVHCLDKSDVIAINTPTHKKYIVFNSLVSNYSLLEIDELGFIRRKQKINL